MKVFILIMAILSTSDQSGHIDTAEFSSIEKCELAGAAFGRAFYDRNGPGWLKAFHLCVEK